VSARTLTPVETVASTGNQPRPTRVLQLDSYLNAQVFNGNPTAQGVEGDYLFSGFEGAKIRFCHIALRLIDKTPWIPSAFANVPLRMCHTELIESVRSYDPDAIDASAVRWANQLHRVLRRRYPQWSSAGATGGQTHADRTWRKHNPAATVSIVLPTYNGSRYIRQSLDSCLQQTFANFEVLVVDDGSSDDIRGIVDGYSDARIRYIRHPRNRGLAEALNTGFRNARGEYLTWTSDDNYYERDAIEEMVRFLETYGDVDFVYADSFVIDDEGNAAQHAPVFRTGPVQSLERDNFIGACFLYRRAVYERTGDYDANLRLVEDYDYWLRVAGHFTMQRLARPLYHYRYHQQSLTSTHSRETVLKKVQMLRSTRTGGRWRRLFRKITERTQGVPR
jgi:hypothetical protein